MVKHIKTFGIIGLCILFGFGYYDIAKKPTIEEMDKGEIYDELFSLLKKVGGMKRAKEICPDKIERILARIDQLTEEENQDYWFL